MKPEQIDKLVKDIESLGPSKFKMETLDNIEVDLTDILAKALDIMSKCITDINSCEDNVAVLDALVIDHNKQLEKLADEVEKLKKIK